LFGRALVELGDWSIASSRELGSALQLLIGIRGSRLGSGELGFTLVDRSFEWLPLDREYHLTFFDGVAVLEQARAKKTLDARPQIDLFERFRAPDKLGLLGHRPQFG
jgi:hypothetical protein